MTDTKQSTVTLADLGVQEENNETGQRLQSHEALSAEIASLIKHDDIQSLLTMQTEVHQKLVQSTQSLSSFNDHSSSLLLTTGKDIEKYTRMLTEMKRDLDYIFKHLRAMKSKLRTRFPNAPNLEKDNKENDEEEEEKEEEDQKEEAQEKKES